MSRRTAAAKGKASLPSGPCCPFSLKQSHPLVNLLPSVRPLLPHPLLPFQPTHAFTSCLSHPIASHHIIHHCPLSLPPRPLSRSLSIIHPTPTLPCLARLPSLFFFAACCDTFLSLPVPANTKPGSRQSGKSSTSTPSAISTRSDIHIVREREGTVIRRVTLTRPYLHTILLGLHCSATTSSGHHSCLPRSYLQSIVLTNLHRLIHLTSPHLEAPSLSVESTSSSVSHLDTVR